MSLGDFCKPCQCSGNIIPGEPGSCDTVTGDCLRCQNNTYGVACALCAPGFFGDAIQAKDCQGNPPPPPHPLSFPPTLINLFLAFAFVYFSLHMRSSGHVPLQQLQRNVRVQAERHRGEVRAVRVGALRLPGRTGLYALQVRTGVAERPVRRCYWPVPLQAGRDWKGLRSVRGWVLELY